MIRNRTRRFRHDAAAPPSVDITELQGWLTGRLPDDWFTETPEVIVDQEEITIVSRLPAPETENSGKDEENAMASAAEAGRIQRFREDTRGDRMTIADEAEHRYGRKVAWGATCGDTRQVFTRVSAPVMTRLHQPERRVLDTLVDAGVARSRSEALAWCVRLVGQHEQEWIDSLREALVGVEQARAAGPRAATDETE